MVVATITPPVANMNTHLPVFVMLPSQSTPLPLTNARLRLNKRLAVEDRTNEVFAAETALSGSATSNVSGVDARQRQIPARLSLRHPRLSLRQRLRQAPALCCREEFLKSGRMEPGARSAPRQVSVEVWSTRRIPNEAGGCRLAPMVVTACQACRTGASSRFRADEPIETLRPPFKHHTLLYGDGKTMTVMSSLGVSVDGFT